jgi:hypothetical protein
MKWILGQLCFICQLLHHCENASLLLYFKNAAVALCQLPDAGMHVWAHQAAHPCMHVCSWGRQAAVSVTVYSQPRQRQLRLGTHKQ